MSAWPKAVLVMAVIGAPLACGRPSDGGGRSGSDAAALLYGQAPPGDSDVTFQPDVVFLDDGPDAIRSVTSDGLTWSIDRNAHGASNIAVGKVLYATSLAVGRVAKIEPRDDTLAVTLAPVDIGEVIEDGRIEVHQPFDLDAALIRSVPDLPGALIGVRADDEQGMTVVGKDDPEALRYRLAAASAPAQAPDTLPTLPPPSPPFTEGTMEWAVGDWSGSVTRNSGDVAFHVETTSGDLKAFADMTLHFVSPWLDADVGIVDGEVGNASLTLSGLREIAFGFEVGSVSGLPVDISQTIDPEISFDWPVIVGGMAFNLQLTFELLVQPAFTAANSTLRAVGAWVTDGPLSYDRVSGAETVRLPTVTPKTSILDSIDGVSIGTNGIVLALETRVMLGLGVPAFTAGPYVRVITSVAVALGSDVGFAGRALRCKQVTVTITGAFGAGLALSRPVAGALDAYFQWLGSAQHVTKDNLSDLLSQPLYSEAFWSPDLDYCKLGS